MGEKTSSLRIGIIVFLAIIGSWAVCMGDTTLKQPFFVQYLPMLCYILDFIFIIFLRKNVFHNTDVFLVLFPVLCFILHITDVYDRNHYSANALLFLNISLFAFITDRELLKAFNILKVFFVVSCAFGIVAYISYMFHLGLPYTTVPYYTEDSAVYVDYHFAYIVDKIGIIRLCGLLNEPGFLGTLVSFFLITDGYNLKKISNIIMFTAGLFSLSSAFFIISFVYFVLIYFKSVKGLTILLISAVSIRFFLLNTDNEMISAMTISKFSGNLLELRSNEYIERALTRLFETGDFLWGYGNGYKAAHFPEGASIKTSIIDFGLLGTAFLYLPLLLLSSIKAGSIREKRIFVLCFFISILQRYNIFTVIYFLILFGGMVYIQSKKVAKITPPSHTHLKSLA